MEFDDEQFYDIPLEATNVPYVTIDEMREILKGKENAWEEEGYVGLRKDGKTGLLYTDYFSWYSPELLYSHLLVEQMMQEPENIDWKRVTNGYDAMIIEYLERVFRNPLVWMETADELDAKYVVVGKVAQAMSCEERNTCEPYDTFFGKIHQDRLLWFADALPTVQDLTRAHYKSEDCILWYMISEDTFYARKISPQFYKGPVHFNTDEFRRNIGFIAQKRGPQRAAELVRLFRQDWPDIVAMKLFKIEELTPEQIEDFRQCLFEGMDRNLRKWEAETGDVSKGKESRDEEVCNIFTKKAKKEGKEEEIRKALQVAMNGRKDKARALVDEVRNWQKEGYIDSNYNAKVMYDGLNVLIPLPFQYGGFRKYYNE